MVQLMYVFSLNISLKDYYKFVPMLYICPLFQIFTIVIININCSGILKIIQIIESLFHSARVTQSNFPASRDGHKLLCEILISFYHD